MNKVYGGWVAESFDRLRALADQAGAATRERDRLILQLRAEGVPLRTIGEAAGLSAPGVAKICARAVPADNHDA